MNNKSTEIIHIWFPGLFGFKGGIQVFSAFFLKALPKNSISAKYTVILKHDETPQLKSSSPHIQFYGCGQWSHAIRTFVFTVQLIWRVIVERPILVIVGHANFTPVAYWLYQTLGTPYWVIAHGIEVWDNQRPLIKKGLENADKVLAVSSFTRNRLLNEQNLDAKKVLVLPNTFDEQEFQIKPKPDYLLERYDLTNQQKIILTVSRLSTTEGYKGYDKVIKALPKIIQATPNIHYVLVGRGNDQPRIEQLIAQLDLENYVTLTGFVPDEELCDHYNLCDVFAMPSKGEGFGIVYLEALACGKPTLAGNKDAAVDALCQGKFGALVDPDNLEEIANSLVQILKGTYPNALMYQPEILRKKVIETFGFSQFKQTLGYYLEQYLTQKNS